MNSIGLSWSKNVYLRSPPTLQITRPMKAISILSASLLAWTLYAFSPNTPATAVPTVDSVVVLAERNTNLLKLNNENLKHSMGLPEAPYVSYTDSTGRVLVLAKSEAPVQQ